MKTSVLRLVCLTIYKSCQSLEQRKRSYSYLSQKNSGCRTHRSFLSIDYEYFHLDKGEKSEDRYSCPEKLDKYLRAEHDLELDIWMLMEVLQVNADSVFNWIGVCPLHYSGTSRIQWCLYFQIEYMLEVASSARMSCQLTLLNVQHPSRPAACYLAFSQCHV